MYPSTYGKAISVAATNNNSVAASFTTYSDFISLSAPGVEVLTTVPVNQGSYSYLSGTGASSAHVAGTCLVGVREPTNARRRSAPNNHKPFSFRAVSCLTFSFIVVVVLIFCV